MLKFKVAVCEIINIDLNSILRVYAHTHTHTHTHTVYVRVRVPVHRYPITDACRQSDTAGSQHPWHVKFRAVRILTRMLVRPLEV
jgi:hypothetical protein